MPSAYIVGGRIERGSGAPSRLGVRTHFLQYLSWHRVLFLVAVAAIFIATNPANMESFEEQTTSPQSTTASYFTSLIWGQTSSGVTNYLFFSVKDTYNALVFMTLGESWACRYDDMDIGFVCDLLTPFLSHGKPLVWDESDPVHTAHRIICWLLVVSAATSFCCPYAPDGRLFDNPVIDSLFSVFYRPHLVSDIGHQCLTVYPALYELHNVLPRLRSDSVWSTGDPDVDFAIAVVFFVLGIGGGSNWIASQLLPKGHTICGFSTVLAASMAYCQRIHVLGPLVVLRWDVLSVNTADIYWTELALIFLGSATSRKAFPRMLAWLIAGALGTALAKYQLENLVIWGTFYKIFG